MEVNMKKYKNIVYGIMLILLGIIIALISLDIIHTNLLFKGWWTLVIIIPSIIGLLFDDDKLGNLISLIIGILLLLGVRNIIDYKILLKLFVPILLVTVGLSLILKNILESKKTLQIKELNKVKDNTKDIFATLSNENKKIIGEFKGISIDAVFSNVELDLREAEIKKDQVINVSTIFSGVTILTNNNIKVIVKSDSLFGGVSNHIEEKDEAKAIYINASCLFGGVEIK
jgi:hypothetical protein ELI_2635